MKQTGASYTILTLLMLGGLTLAEPVTAQSISNDELINYARAAAQGQATAQQKAVLFANNERVNNLAIAGRISNSDYQFNQREFVAQNDSLVREVSRKHGLAVAPAKQSDGYKPGTDTDRQLQNRSGELTVNQVKSVRNSYNQEVSNYLKSQGVKTSAGENWAGKLATDIMPSPYDMKPSDFKAASSFINENGGLAYTSAAAAKIQLEIDSNRAGTPALHEATAYHNEMQKKICQMNAEIQTLKRQRSTVADSDSRENLDIEIRKRTAFMSKYIARDNQIADLITSGSSKDGPLEVSYTDTSASKIRQAQKRDATAATIRAEAHVGAVNTHLAAAATRRFNEALAVAATTNGSIDSARTLIASNLKNLSPKQQSQAIEDLEIKYSGLGKQVAGELKKMNNVKTPTPRNLTACKTLGLANTLLNVSNQYSEGKTTTEILWNMSIGATLETVNKETADYTSQEIERLKVKYLSLGENPDSMAVKLKIMAEATVKGTFHGSVIGSYDLLKSATSTTAGAALTVADSALFLAGEALDTNNVLETSYAEIKAQNMEQSVQNARALKFGREGISELQRLADEAAHLKNVLEQNVRSARLFCRNSENSLDEIKAEIRELNELEGTETLKLLPETEKKLTATLVETAKTAKTMTARAETALKAVIAGGSAKEAEQTAQVLTASYNRQMNALEHAKNELFKIGGLAGLSGAANLLSGLENRKAGLLEQTESAVSGAKTMRNNEALFKKTAAEFDSLKSRLASTDSFFAGKREANEAEWMIVKSRLTSINRPDASMPPEFFGEVGTLERLPDRIRSELAKLQTKSEITGLSEAGKQADAVLNKLTPLYNDTGKSLSALKTAIDALNAAARNKPAPVEQPVAKQPPPRPSPKVQQPAKPAPKNDGRLPCGHLPGQCPTSGIQSVNCRLKNGEISQR